MIYLDIETLDFFSDDHIKPLPRPVQLLAMRFGMATTYHDIHGWAQWWPARYDDEFPHGYVEWDDGMHPVSVHPAGLSDLWQLLVGQTVVGWNIFDFDLPFLMLHLVAAGLADKPWRDAMRVIDLMDLCKRASTTFGKERWYKLQDISQANLFRGKSADGQQAAAWLRGDDPALWRQAADYCRLDVGLCIDLFQRAQTDGLLLPARPERNEHGDLRLWLSANGEIVECKRQS